MNRCALAALTLCTALVACEDGPTSPEAVGPVVAAGTATGIRPFNTSSEPLAFTTIDRRSLAQFAPCADPSPQCLRLAPRATLVTPYTDAIGFSSETTEVLVYWWRVESVPAGGFRPEEIHSMTVTVSRET